MPRVGPNHFVIPGLMAPDGITELRFPFDKREWEAEFYPAILAHRLRVARETHDPHARAARSIQKALCSHNSVEAHAYYLLTFGWIHEPRNPPGDQDLPFILHPRQLEFLIELHDVMATERGPRSSLAVEKSREVGATWLDASHNVWGWQFLRNWSCMLLSLDADTIDKEGVPGSWFYKHDYLLKRQPSWLLPKGFDWAKERGHYRTDKLLLNPETDAVIVGSATTPDASRGERYYKISIDEAGYDRYFDDHWNNTYHVADHRICYSTATRKIPHFFNLIHGLNGWKRPRVFRMEWHAMVGRGAAWLKAARDSMEESKFRREVLIEYDAEIGGWTYPEYRLKQVETLSWDHHRLPVIGIDDGYDDEFAIVIGLADTETKGIDVMAGYTSNRKPIRFYGTLFSGELNHTLFDYDEHDLWFSNYCVTRRLIARGQFYGDKHGDNTSLTDGRSPFDILLSDFGIYVFTTHDPELASIKGRREALREMHHHWRFHDADGAPLVLGALQFNHFSERKVTSTAVSELKTAVHDGTSHFTTACEYIVTQHLVRPEPSNDELPRNIRSDSRGPTQRGRRHLAGEHVLWTQ